MKTTRRKFLTTSAALAGSAAFAAIKLGAAETAGRRFCWRAESVSPDIQPMLQILGEEYPLREIQKGAPRGGEVLLRIEHDANTAGYSVRLRDGEAVIRYAKLSCAGRALGTLLAGLVDEGATVEDRPAFTMLGIVLDCGHNATVRPDHFRKWLRRLALLGYDTAMIYTEAGYQLPGEPCFGYMRGNYKPDDLKALDQYAAQLGIEMIGAIQALGHLEQLLKWPPYAGLRDTEHVLLVGEPRTYALIEKMVAHWAGVFRSRRFHLGMDETYDLGRGRYLDRKGHRRGLDIYAEHLKRVAEICARHGLRPMIWSDVLFKLANVSGGHYDPKSRIPAEVAAALPKNLDLVYWDYYKADKKHYL
ncbi:MAG: twin-arginine translocation signal domain-containing protein, partial [Verrucomicrobia bacterium]|nr:twin-arginine translocation signal domain-containing protein [Verrucomicrobiota bacterium]